MRSKYDQDYYFHCVEVGQKTVRLFPKLSDLENETDKWDLLEFWRNSNTASEANTELRKIRRSSYNPEAERLRKKKRYANRGRPKGT